MGTGSSSGNGSLVPQRINDTTHNFAKFKYVGSTLLALTDTGDIYSWGYNSYGLLGLGYSNTSQEIYGPERINLSNIVDINGDFDSMYALTSTGDVYSWGYNYYGQLGIGNTTNAMSPTKVNFPS